MSCWRYGRGKACWTRRNVLPKAGSMRGWQVWEGKGVVKSARKLIGATNPLEAEPGTIRGDLAMQTGRNVVHGSDSPENGERETGAPALSLVFSQVQQVSDKLAGSAKHMRLFSGRWTHVFLLLSPWRNSGASHSMHDHAPQNTVKVSRRRRAAHCMMGATPCSLGER